MAIINRGEPAETGGQVIVVGGGNTAIDAARCARRTGATVTILYRRSREEMPAIAEEVDEAIDEGIQVEFLTAPLTIGRDNGMRRLVCQRMALGEPDESGRRRPVPIEDSTFEIPCDRVILAIGRLGNPRKLGIPGEDLPGVYKGTDSGGRLTFSDKPCAGGELAKLLVAAKRDVAERFKMYQQWAALDV